MMTRRPSVTLQCVADRYAAAGERIVEFNANDGSGTGGLLSLRLIGGVLMLDVYRLDPAVRVRVSQHGRTLRGSAGRSGTRVSA